MAATLASLDMQSGPISSTVCGKWHVPPEEAQKQLQPAINYTPPWAGVCLWRQNHAWGLMSLLASLKGGKKKKTVLLVGCEDLIRPSVQETVPAFFSPTYCCEIGCKHDRKWRSGARRFDSVQFRRCESVSFWWNPSRPRSWPFLGSEDLILIPQKMLFFCDVDWIPPLDFGFSKEKVQKCLYFPRLSSQTVAIHLKKISWVWENNLWKKIQTYLKS